MANIGGYPDKRMNFLENKTIICGSKVLDLRIPVAMGILNVTPDSFYDGGTYTSHEELLKKADLMISDGATIIDIGAISTRPGAQLLTAEEEMVRLLKPLKLLRSHFPEVILSIDTYRKSVAVAAVEEGADIINDISGGLLDNEMIKYMCTQNAAYVLMHMQGTPETMQQNPHYEDVVHDVESFFLHQLEPFKKVKKENIILDPGFGFGKTIDHNYRLLDSLSKFTSLSYPILAGVSRKSMINKVLATTPADALNGTTVINTIALMKGANILRVHDCKQAMEAIKLVNQFRQSNGNS